MKGKFIVIEGLEGAGKSSAVQALMETIRSQGHKVITTREPGGTPMAEAIRDCVKHDWHEQVTEQAELLLMYAARVQLLENVIKPNLAKGVWVVGDRHDLSTQAYQGGGRQIDCAKLQALRDIVLGDFRPDFTLYMDVSPEVGLNRARGRGELDRIEQAGLAFFERTRQRYIELVQQDPNATLINTMQPMEQVHQEVVSAINTFMEIG